MTGNCPACRHEVSIMATNCPNCGHGPLAGHYIRGMHLSPEERASRDDLTAKFAGLVILGLVGLVVVLGAGWVLCNALLNAGEAVGRIPFGSIFGAIGHALGVFFGWAALVVIILLPFGLIGGYLAKSAGRMFSQGYWWGQLLGPIGVIVVLFKPSEDEGNPPQEIAEEPSHQGREVTQRIAYSCSSCGKKYSLSPSAVGQRFNCTKCGANNIVVSSTVRPVEVEMEFDDPPS